MPRQDDFDRLEKLFQMLFQMLKVSGDVADTLLTKYQRDYQEERGLRAIMHFIEHGGTAEQITIGEEQADRFRQRLQERHVSYYETIITRDDNSKQHMFLFKGTMRDMPTPDKLQVEKIKKVFELELSSNTKELDVHSFKSLMRGKEIGVADNLTLEQVYAFRQNVKDANLKYCVLQGKDNSYKIYADSEPGMANVLVRMSYDIANDEAGIFKDAVNRYAAKKHDFYDRAGTEPFVVCDRVNPNNFIYVDKHNYSLHSFQKQPELQPDGTTIDVIRDATKPCVYTMDKDKLFDCVKQISNPVVMSVAEFQILDSVNKNGVAFPSQDIADIYAGFKKVHKEDELLIDKYPVVEPRYQERDLAGYINLPSSFVQKIKHDLPYVHTDDISSIAFTKEMKPLVDAYMKEQIFDKIADPMQALAFQWKIEGRTGAFHPSFDKPEQAFYVLSPDNDKTAICVNKEGAAICRAGQEPEFLSADDALYKETLQNYINKDRFPNPVILTAEEMQADNKNEIIAGRANLTVENPAIIAMTMIEENEKEELVNNIHHLDDISLSPEQQKAAEDIKRMHISSKSLDNAIFTEMQDMSINRYLSKDTEMDL